jgi:hypothetical protein
VVFGVDGERGTQTTAGQLSGLEVNNISRGAGYECGDRFKVLAIGFCGVWRWLTNRPVG